MIYIYIYIRGEQATRMLYKSNLRVEMRLAATIVLVANCLLPRSNARFWSEEKPKVFGDIGNVETVPAGSVLGDVITGLHRPRKTEDSWARRAVVSSGIPGLAQAATPRQTAWARTPTHAPTPGAHRSTLDQCTDEQDDQHDKRTRRRAEPADAAT